MQKEGGGLPATISVPCAKQAEFRYTDHGTGSQRNHVILFARSPFQCKHSNHECNEVRSMINESNRVDLRVFRFDQSLKRCGIKTGGVCVNTACCGTKLGAAILSFRFLQPKNTIYKVVVSI